MSKQPDVVCAFCGHGTARFDDPDFAKKALEHIVACEKHPLWAYAIMNAKLLAACEALILGGECSCAEDQPMCAICIGRSAIFQSKELGI